MKLTKAIGPLKDLIEEHYISDKDFKDSFVYEVDERGKNPDIKDKWEAMRYTMWYGLPTGKRHEILGFDTSVTDAHIKTLLMKVLPTAYLINLYACAKANALMKKNKVK